MKRRNFIRLSALAGLLAGAKGVNALPVSGNKLKKEIYEWRIYNMTGDASVLDTYLEKALTPALNKYKVKVGAFKLFKEESAVKRFYLFVYPSIETYHQV